MKREVANMEVDSMRRNRKSRTGKDTLTTSWHLRKIREDSGSFVVALPPALIELARQQTGEPFRWGVGEYVRVGLLPDGVFVIAPMPESHLRGFLYDPARMEQIAELTSPKFPKPYRKQVRIRERLDDGSIGETKWADSDERDDVFVPKKVPTPWNIELVEIRRKYGFTQERVAKILSTTNITVSRWENGHNTPSKKRREEFLRLLYAAGRYIEEEGEA